MTAGLPFAQCTVDEATHFLLDWGKAHGRGLAVHVIAAHGVSVADRDAEFRQIVSRDSVIFPDSRWLQFLTSLSRTPLTQVRGPSLMRKMLEHPSSSALRHIFLSPNESVDSSMRLAVPTQFPHLKESNFAVFPHKKPTAEDVKDILKMVAHPEKTIIWIGNGTPMQNYLSDAIAQESRCVAIGVGAAFDFICGTQSEAPAWISKIGAEWFFRLASEPKRLWKRYTVGNFLFLWAMLKGVLRGDARRG